MLPHLQRRSASVHNFVRGGTWISQPFGGQLTQETIAAGDEPGNYSYTIEELAKFKEDPQFYKKFRKTIERSINMDYPCLFPGSPEELHGTRMIRENMHTKLASKPTVLKAIEPRFVPGCRRLTPGPGYLEALASDNVDFITTPIAKITKDVCFSTHLASLFS